jgi:hypothetical protein
MSAKADVPRLAEAAHAPTPLRERNAKPGADRTRERDAADGCAVSADAAEAGGLA